MTGVRRGGSSPSSGAGSDTTWPRPSGHEATDDARLAAITAGARCTFDELTAAGWVERDHELPAPWVERHLDRLGGWRLAPQLLVDQLAALAPSSTQPQALVLVPRRQPRHLNSQLDFLGEVVEVVIHPDDAAAAGVVDGQSGAWSAARGVSSPASRRSIRPSGPARCRYRTATRAPTSTGSPYKDDIDHPTGMALYSGIPVTLHGTAEPPTE